MPYKWTTPRGYAASRNFRRDPTPAEMKLWSVLRDNRLMGIKFRRQHAIGSYVVDFCAIKQKLIIELDGSGHLEQHEYDQDRTTFLNSKGFRVLRFWNNQVMSDLDTVIRVIMDFLAER